jgi:hypothetical protein
MWALKGRWAASTFEGRETRLLCGSPVFGREASPAHERGTKKMLRLRRLARDPVRLRLLAVLPLVIVSTLVLTGCEKLTGGGWIPSLAPGEKATFGFSARCRDSTDALGLPVALLYEGQFEFDDHAANPQVVRVHGDIEPPVFANVPGTCQDVANELDVMMTGIFSGTYRTQPKMGPSSEGEFGVQVFDNGQGATIDDDVLCVDLVGFAVGGLAYHNCGDVEGGNIQVH